MQSRPSSPSSAISAYVVRKRQVREPPPSPGATRRGLSRQRDAACVQLQGERAVLLQGGPRAALASERAVAVPEAALPARSSDGWRWRRRVCTCHIRAVYKMVICSPVRGPAGASLTQAAPARRAAAGGVRAGEHAAAAVDQEAAPDAAAKAASGPASAATRVSRRVQSGGAALVTARATQPGWRGARV